MEKRASGRRAGLITTFLFLLMILLAITQFRHIHDWYKLRDYQPPAEIAEIAEQTKMTDKARKLFYINHPVLEPKEDFRSQCPNYEATIVIGCYRQGQRGIHVLRVDDARLEGVEQVTSAHEMLHAAYERLSTKERQAVDGWLEDYARNVLSDERVKQTMKSYEKTEPTELTNEMHAIFGTEIAELPDELDRYYSKYFTDRSAVVAFAERYQEAFTSRQKQVADYDAKLNALNTRIKANTQLLDSQRRELGSSEDDLMRYQKSGDIGRYNAGVPEYNRRVIAYNQLLEQTKVLIDEHNKLVEERNTVAEQTVELRQAIDSASLPASQ